MAKTLQPVRFAGGRGKGGVTSGDDNSDDEGAALISKSLEFEQRDRRR